MAEPIQTEWLEATLTDAREALDAAIEELAKHPEEADEILQDRVAEVYAKLNYAVNTARCGASGLDLFSEDELVAYPRAYPFGQAEDEAA